MRWVHAVPIEGLLGRLLGDLLVHYLNYAGACIVALTAIAAALYLATAFSLAASGSGRRRALHSSMPCVIAFRIGGERRAKAHELKLLAKKQRLREKQEEAAASAAIRQHALARGVPADPAAP